MGGSSSNLLEHFTLIGQSILSQSPNNKYAGLTDLRVSSFACTKSRRSSVEIYIGMVVMLPTIYNKQKME